MWKAILLLATITAPLAPAASTIDTTQRFAYAANVGWVDTRGGDDGTNGLVIGEYVCSGHVYSANCGWISLGDGSSTDGVQYGNTSGDDFGINHLGDGRLRGLAWSANLGWLNFEHVGNPRIDLVTGRLDGFVWSANCGWISLRTAADSGVQTNTIEPGPDSDGDGLPDAWEYEYTPHLETLGGNGDNDGDGETNAAEYAADTNPLDATDRFRITSFAVEVIDQETSWATLTWTSRPTRLYRIQSQENLQPASWLFGDQPSDLIPGDPGLQTTRDFSVPAVLRGFYRVEVLVPLSPSP